MQYEAKYAIDGRVASDAPSVCQNEIDIFDWGDASGCDTYIPV